MEWSEWFVLARFLHKEIKINFFNYGMKSYVLVALAPSIHSPSIQSQSPFNKEKTTIDFISIYLFIY